jgi:hypothetical protein
LNIQSVIFQSGYGARDPSTIDALEWLQELFPKIVHKTYDMVGLSSPNKSLGQHKLIRERRGMPLCSSHRGSASVDDDEHPLSPVDDEEEITTDAVLIAAGCWMSTWCHNGRFT